MSDIRISVGANADPAKRSIKELGKDVKELQKDALNVKIGTETGASSRAGASPSSGSDYTDKLIETIERLTSTIERNNRSGPNNNSSPIPSSPSPGGGGSFSSSMFGDLGKLLSLIHI